MGLTYTCVNVLEPVHTISTGKIFFLKFMKQLRLHYITNFYIKLYVILKQFIGTI